MRLGLWSSAGLDVLVYATSSTKAVCPKSYVSGEIYCKSLDARFRIRGGTDDLYNVMPGREADVDRFIRDHLEAGGSFIDVGANAGYYSVIAGKAVGTTGRVLAIEPVPSTYEALRTNLVLNGLDQVETVRKACWDSRAAITMHVPVGLFGMASPLRFVGGTAVPVDGCPLDDLSTGFERVNLLKIDAEYSELQVLKGARATLARTDRIVLELSKDNEEIIRVLHGLSFKTQPMVQYPNYLVAYKDEGASGTAPAR